MKTSRTKTGPDFKNKDLSAVYMVDKDPDTNEKFPVYAINSNEILM